MHPWKKWYDETKDQLDRTIDSSTIVRGKDRERSIIREHYAKNLPVIVDLPHWRAFDWHLDRMRRIQGDVQVQVNRSSNPLYEEESHKHRGTMSFRDFIDMLEDGSDNEIYMTAQNQEHNKVTMNELYHDISPMPSYLTDDSRSGFFWFGKNTITPLHHDLTNNMMCQVMGAKLIRVMPPSEFDKVDYKSGVHCGLGWPTEEIILRRSIKTYDYYVFPGDAFFLPVGWWHCVKSFGISLTVVFTNFIWSNSWDQNFLR